MTLLWKNYSGHIKSSGGGTLTSFKTFKEIFSLYGLVVKTMFYPFIIFDHSTTNVIVIKFR
jgi:hypothetical protein